MRSKSILTEAKQIERAVTLINLGARLQVLESETDLSYERLQRLYEWSARELDEPRLLELVRDGNPIYAWPFERRHVWRSPNTPPAARILKRVTRAR